MKIGGACLKGGSGVLRDKLIVLIASLLVGASVFYGSSFILRGSFVQSLHQDAQDSLNRIEVVASDIASILESLNVEGIDDCSNDTLLKMRQAMFASSFIKGIAFVQDGKILCSTGVGKLEHPLIRPAPDFISKNEASVWLDVPIQLTGEETRLIAVQYGSFSAVVSHDVLDHLFAINMPWVLELADSLVSNIEGDVIASGQARIDDAEFGARDCSEMLSYCLTIGATEPSFQHEYKLALIGWFVISVLIAIFTALAGCSLMCRYHSTEARVMRGLRSGAFYCLYQPIVELCSGRVIGCEALARYSDADGDIYPDAFIPLISARQKTWPFTGQIISRVLNDLDAVAGLPPPFKININFFAKDIENGNILELITQTEMSRDGVQFVLEVTEDEKLSSFESSDVLAELAGNGFQIAVDDFGTGYSNLRQIRDFQCNTLKIDRSFISEMEGGSVRSTLIPHIVDIAGKIGAEVVAEGIENEMQHRALVDVGVRYGQGYLFGKPMSFEELVTLTNNQSTA